MISEGSCDTEEWSNDAENSDLPSEINYILQYNQIYKKIKIVIILTSQYYCFYCIFDQINVAFASIWDFYNCSKGFLYFFSKILIK